MCPGTFKLFSFSKAARRPQSHPFSRISFQTEQWKRTVSLFFDREKRKERRLDTAFLNKVSGWPPGLVRPPAARLMRGLRRRQPGRADAVWCYTMNLMANLQPRAAAVVAVVSQLFCTPLLSSHPDGDCTEYHSAAQRLNAYTPRNVTSR